MLGQAVGSGGFGGTPNFTEANFPPPGTVVMRTASRLLAGVSLVSVKPKFAAVNILGYNASKSALNAFTVMLAKELAPEEDQGIVFAVVKAPKYANIDYTDFYSRKMDKAFAAFPETDLRFVINGTAGPSNGIAGIRKPVPLGAGGGRRRVLGPGEHPRQHPTHVGVEHRLPLTEGERRDRCCRVLPDARKRSELGHVRRDQVGEQHKADRPAGRKTVERN